MGLSAISAEMNRDIVCRIMYAQRVVRNEPTMEWDQINGLWFWGVCCI